MTMSNQYYSTIRGLVVLAVKYVSIKKQESGGFHCTAEANNPREKCTINALTRKAGWVAKTSGDPTHNSNMLGLYEDV